MKSPRNGAETPTGAHPGNTGGKKGRSGRKPKAFIQRCIAAAEDQRLWQAAIEKNPNSVLAMAASYAHGLPKQAIEAEGRLTFEVVLVDGTKRGRRTDSSE